MTPLQLHETLNCPHWREVEALRFPHSTPHGDSHQDLVIVGAGPVGLTLALDLAMRGIPSVILEKLDRVSIGSRAICWSRRTLEIFERIGIASILRTEGTQWRVGRVYHREREIYSQALTPETFQQNPFFVNFQQSLCEYLLIEKCREYPIIDIRWANEVIDLETTADHSRLTTRCDQGEYAITAKYLLACDGAKSFVRRKLGLNFKGHYFNDRFLIVDIEMKNAFPAERKFWFEPPFHEGQSALLHKQPQNIWRIDFQLNGQESKTMEELRKETDETFIEKRVRAFLGQNTVEFKIVWHSIYQFACRRLKKFTVNNVFFVGDSAHTVSPFGARGGNGGIQDADNIGWKLAETLHGRANSTLLRSYDEERIPASQENIVKSSQTTDFMSPKSKKTRKIRDCVLSLAGQHPFAVQMVNGGRMSEPFSYRGIGIFKGNTPAPRVLQPGDVAVDIPLRHSLTGQDDYLLRHIRNYTILAYRRPPVKPCPAFDTVCVNNAEHGTNIWHDTQALCAKYYVNTSGGYVLFRPDQYLLGLWEDTTPAAAINMVLRHRTGLSHE